jgi:hypothetical protein
MKTFGSLQTYYPPLDVLIYRERGVHVSGVLEVLVYSMVYST